MKSFVKFLIIPLSVVSLNASSASQDECSIWLCLPGGFPAGCAAAHSAMINRIKDRKSPLPDFSSCAVSDNSGSNFSSKHNYAAYVPEHQVCTKWKQYYNYSLRQYEQRCVATKTVPEKYIKNTTCRIYRQTRDGELTHNPEFCSKTVRYIDVLENGIIMGDTYYY